MASVMPERACAGTQRGTRSCYTIKHELGANVPEVVCQEVCLGQPRAITIFKPPPKALIRESSAGCSRLSGFPRER